MRNAVGRQGTGRERGERRGEERREERRKLAGVTYYAARIELSPENEKPPDVSQVCY